MTIAEVRRFALSLPGVEEKPHFELWSFRVGGKIFATVPPDELHLHLFLGEEEREPWIAAQPGAFEKLSWGAKVVGLRILVAAVRPEALRELLRSAWRSKAPQRLLAQAATPARRLP